MIYLVPLVVLLLCVFTTVITVVQTLYLESVRLRTRDLPSLAFFKASLEERLGMHTDRGALTFSLVKHAVLLLLGIVVLAGFIDGSRDSWSQVLQALITSWLLMVAFGFFVPQIIYRRSTGHWLVPIVPVLRAIAIVVRPLAAFLAFVQSLVEITNENKTTGEPPTQAENIDALITAGTEEGMIEEEDRKLIQSVVEFGDKTVREIMTPRPEIVSVRSEASLEQLRQLVINEQYSRIPVYEETIDNIIGFVHVRDIFELEESDRAERTVRDLMRPIRIVPETKPANDLLREMQQEGAHMVVVVDEYGNTAGLVTMEDLVEVILGEIRDEHEPESDVTEDGQGGYILSGSFDLARLEEMLEFHPDEEIESTTVGGLVGEWLGRVPEPGEVIEREGIRVEILASDQMHVEQVSVRRSQAVAHE